MDQPRPIFVYFRCFQTQILQKKLQASVGLELGSQEQKASTLTTTTTSLYNCSICFIKIVITSFEQLRFKNNKQGSMHYLLQQVSLLKSLQEFFDIHFSFAQPPFSCECVIFSLSVYPSINCNIFQQVRTSLQVDKSISLSHVHLSVWLAICLQVCLLVFPICLHVQFFVCLSVC